MSRLRALLAASASFGFLVGGLTVALAVTSAAAVLLLYMTTARLGLLRVGDWLVLGYVGALVLAASMVMTSEMVGMLRAHVPENLGVKTSLVPSVQWRG